MVAQQPLPTMAKQARAPQRYSLSWVLALVATDCVMFLLSAYVGGAIVDHNWTTGHLQSRFLRSSVVFIAMWFLIFEYLGLYRRSIALSIKDEFYYTAVALMLGIVPQLALFTVVPALSTSRLILLVSAAAAIFLVGTMRATIHGVRAAAAARKPRRIAIIGSRGAQEGLDAYFSASRGTQIHRFSLPSDSQATSSTPAPSRPSPGSPAETYVSLIKSIEDLRCDTVVLSALPPTYVMPWLLNEADRLRMKVFFIDERLECHGFDMALVRRRPRPEFILTSLPVCKPPAQLTKRLVDVFLSAVALIVSSPVMGVAALAIWLDSGRPVFYQQERVGRHGRLFKILKFRSMRPNTDAQWAKTGDPRITRIGALLRRTSMDELPQFINVFRGDMSIVGPRPEMTEFAHTFAERFVRYGERHLVRPGITGWAQVNMKRTLTPDDISAVLEHDLFYIENWSLYLDFSILFKTAAEFLFHRAV